MTNWIWNTVGDKMIWIEEKNAIGAGAPVRLFDAKPDHLDPIAHATLPILLLDALGLHESHRDLVRNSACSATKSVRRRVRNQFVNRT